MLGLCFRDEFFLPLIIFSGVLFWGTIFLGPIGQEAKAKTVIFSGRAITAGQFLVIVIITVFVKMIFFQNLG